MQQASAIALHNPEKLYARNRSLLKMKSEDLRDYASTPHKGLPKRSVPLTELMKRRKRRK
jgi:hypothetical protein